MNNERKSREFESFFNSTGMSAELLEDMVSQIVDTLAKDAGITVELDAKKIEEVRALVEREAKMQKITVEGRISVFRIAALYSYWFNSLKPLHQKSSLLNRKPVNEFKFLNEFVALQVGISLISIAKYDFQRNVDIDDKLFKEAMYSLRYKNVSADNLYWIFHALDLSIK